MLTKLEATRSRGYGVDDEESADMMRAVAVALPRSDGTHNAVSVSAPTLRLPRELVPEVAQTIQAQLAQVAPWR